MGVRLETVPCKSGAPRRFWKSEPGLAGVLALSLLPWAVYLLILVLRHGDYWDFVLRYLDNSSYLAISHALRHWDAGAFTAPKHLWGFPLAVALVARLLSVPDPVALVLVSAAAAVGSVILMYRLFGGWVTAVFVAIGYQWVRCSLLGGSDTLFFVTLLGGFAAARKERWVAACFLAALSTVVRPLGIFALLAFFLFLAYRRSFQVLLPAAGVAAGVAIAYGIPLYLAFGSLFANFRGYRSDWRPYGPIVTLPLVPVVRSFAAQAYTAKWTLQASNAVWVMFAAVAAVIGARSRSLAAYCRRYPFEVLFAGAYFVFLLSFNVDYIVEHWPRYLIPVMPVALLAVDRGCPGTGVCWYRSA